MSTFNNFKSTKVCGNFSNSDYPDGSVLADGVFDRNLSVKNDLWLGKVVINYNENGQPISAVESGGTIRFFYQGIQYNIRPMDLIQLDGEKFSLIAMRSWVIEQLGLTLQNYLLSSTAQSTYQPIILYDTIPTLNSSRMITSGNLFNIFQNYALNSSLNNYALTSSLSNYALTSSLNSYASLSANNIYTGTQTFNNNISFTGTLNNINTTTLSFISTLSSNAQTQLTNLSNTKANIASPNFTSYAYFQNINGVLPVSNSAFLALGSNLSAGHAEGNFLNTASSIQTSSLMAFNFSKLLTSTTKSDLFRIFNNGNANLLGLLTVNDIQTNGTNPITSLNTSINTINTNITTANSNISTLQGQMTTANNNITTANNNITTANNNISTLQTQMTTANNNISTLQTQMTTANNNISTLQTQMTTANNNISTLQTQMTTANNNTTSANNNISTLQTQMTTANNNISTLQSQMTTANNNITTANNNISTLQTQMTTANNSISTLQTQMTTANNNITSANNNISTLQGQMTTANNNISTLQGQMTTANNNISTLQTQMTTANSNISTLQGQMTTANSNISTLQGQMTTANSNISTLQGQMTTANNRITDLRGRNIDTGLNNGWYRIGTLTGFNNFEFPNVKIRFVNRAGEVIIYATIGSSGSNTIVASANYTEISNNGSYIINSSANIGYVIFNNSTIDFYMNLWQYVQGNIYYDVVRATFTPDNFFSGTAQPPLLVNIQNNIISNEIVNTSSVTATNFTVTNNINITGFNTPVVGQLGHFFNQGITYFVPFVPSGGHINHTTTIARAGVYQVIGEINDANWGNPAGSSYTLTLTASSTSTTYRNSTCLNGAVTMSLQVCGIFVLPTNNSVITLTSSGRQLTDVRGISIEYVRIA